MLDSIPLSLVQSAMDLTEPRPMPAGDGVSWVQRWGRDAAIVVMSFDDRVARLSSHGVPPAPGRGLGGGCYAWTPDGDQLVYVTSAGDLWAQPVDGTAGRAVVEQGGTCRAPVVDGASEFVVYVVDEAKVMLTSLGGGETRRLDDGRHEFCFDPCVAPDGRTVSWTGWSPPDMPWDGSVRVDRRLDDGTVTVAAVADGAIQQPRFAPDGTPTCVHDGAGWLNVHIGSEPVVAEESEHAGPTWGMGNRSYDVSPDGGRVVFTRNEAGHGSLNVVDVASGRTTRLGRGVHGQVTWMPDGEQVLALRSGARTPNQIVLYDVGQTPNRTVLAIGPNASWPVDDLPEPDLVETPSADGAHILHARRYTLRDGRGDARPRLLCWVHGGPTDQWQVEWRPRFSYWLSRGWDLLVVDPRGTTGHGRRYQQALHGGWGRIDVDDTADLIRFAHRCGWATPETTVMMGGSSGGLTALGVLADHPDLIAGGVTSYPVSDLLALIEATHRFEAHYTDTLVGPLPEAASRYTELSPLHRAERITTPVLLFHGTDDPVVPIGQSDALADRIRSAGGDLEYVVYEGEGHGFRDPDNVADEYARTETFLERIVPR